MLADNTFDEVDNLKAEIEELKQAHSAEITDLRDGHIAIMEEILGRYNRLRGAVLHLLEFRGEQGQISDNDSSRDAVSRLEMAVSQ